MFGMRGRPPLQKPPPGTLVDLTDPLADACAFAFLLNEGSGTWVNNGLPGAQNFHGNASPGSVWGIDDHGNPCFIGNGSSTYITLGPQTGSAGANLASPLYLNGQMSVNLRLAPGNNSSLEVIAGANNSSGTAAQWWIECNRTAGKFGFSWNSGVSVLTGSQSFTLNAWTSLTALRTGAAGAWGAFLYENAILDNSTTSSTNPNGGTGTYGALGRYGADNAFWFSGKIGHLFGWNNRVLTQPDLLRLETDPYSWFQWPVQKYWFVPTTFAGFKPYFAQPSPIIGAGVN